MPPTDEPARISCSILAFQPTAGISSARPHPSIATSPPSSSSSSFLLYGAAGAVGLLTLASLPFLVVPMLKGNALPYMNIPLAKYKNLFDKTLPRHLKRRRPGSPPLQFIDLGHGFGEAVVSATQRGYIATGVELNPTLYLLSIWNLWRHRLWWPFDARVRLVCGDMWKQDLRFAEQDVILMFGVQSLMARLTAKVQAEAKHDALVVLYRFQLTLPSSSSSTVAGAGEEEGGRSGLKGNNNNNKKPDAEIELLEVSGEEFSVYRVHRPITAGSAGGAQGALKLRTGQASAATGTETLQK